MGYPVEALYRTFHSHHIHRDEWGKERPDVVAKIRGGSNCGRVSLGRSLEFYLRDQGSDAIAVTDHSRDGQQEKSRHHVAELFYIQMLERPDWQQQVFGLVLQPGPLTAEDRGFLNFYCLEAATKLIMYGDHRLWDNQRRIDDARLNFLGKLILAGVEVNLLPDGSLDTTMVHDGDFDVVVMALHPNVDEDGFAGIMANPDAYSWFLAEAIGKHPAHILAHPGFEGMLQRDRGLIVTDPFIDSRTMISMERERRYRLQLDWKAICLALRDTNIALEINFSPQHKYLCREVMTSGGDWRDGWQEMLHHIPLLESTEELAPQLRWYLQHGLLLTINNDSHEVPSEEAMSQHRDRWDEAMAGLAETVGQGLERLGAPVDQVINTWPVEELERFFSR